MNQDIRFCKTNDGARLAYARIGQGPPLVKAGTWLSHLEYDWNSPVWQPWLENWSRFHSLYRYDQRGCGLSDWNVSDFSFDPLVGDLEVIVDAARLDQFDLLGMSQGAAVAIAYTARHPERVKRLIIYGGYVRGALRRNRSPEEIEVAEMDLNLLKMRDEPGYSHVIPAYIIPDGTPEQVAWYNKLQLVSTPAENAVRLQQTFQQVDIRDLANTISIPTLVLQAKNDQAVPFEEGRITASHIPGARFITLDSRNHILLSTEPAWPHFWNEFYRFLGINIETPRENTGPSIQDRILLKLSAREREVLRLVAEGYPNAEIARKLVLSEKTIRNHVSNIYAKLQINSRGEAIVLAHKFGLVKDIS